MAKVSDVEYEDLGKVGTRTILNVIKAGRGILGMCCCNRRSEVEMMSKVAEAR